MDRTNRERSRPPGDHGKVRRWLDGCRCEHCTATIDRLREIARRNLQPYGRLPVDLYLVGAEHGTSRGNELYGCECGPCRHAAYLRKSAQNKRRTG